jgi:S-adenosylmethionine hydrolase
MHPTQGGNQNGNEYMSSTTVVITLLTDFGLSDGYVAAVKGVIASAAPEVRVIDACHEIPFADVMSGAWVLSQYWSTYPSGTIHVAVVDPGVGSARKILLAEVDGHRLLAPDNGLLTRVLQQAKKSRVWALKGDVHRPGEVSSTFHGRDIFAWAAALLANGAKTQEIGEPVERWIALDLFEPKVSAKGIEGAVIHIDRFGNLITNISRKTLDEMKWTSYLIRTGSCAIVRLSTTYAELPPGQPAALIGSSDHLEISMAGESAALRLGIQRGDPVRIRRKAGEH